MVAVPKALSILTVSQSPWSPFAASLVLEHALSVKAAVSPMATVKLHRRLTGLAVGSVIFLLAWLFYEARTLRGLSLNHQTMLRFFYSYQLILLYSLASHLYS